MSISQKGGENRVSYEYCTRTSPVAFKHVTLMSVKEYVGEMKKNTEIYI
jgi:hypothetical protein